MASRSPPYNPGSFPGHALQEFNPPWLPIPCFHYLATPLFSHVPCLPLFLLSASLQTLTLITCTALALRTISAGCCCCFAKLTAPLTVPELDPLIKLLCRSGAIIAVSRKLSYLPSLGPFSPKESLYMHAHDLTTPYIGFGRRPTACSCLDPSAYCLVPIQFSRYPVTAPHRISHCSRHYRPITPHWPQAMALNMVQEGTLAGRAWSMYDVKTTQPFSQLRTGVGIPSLSKYASVSVFILCFIEGALLETYGFRSRSVLISFSSRACMPPRSPQKALSIHFISS
jgi:hypothetical protein